LWPPRCGGKDRLKFTGLSILPFRAAKVKHFPNFFVEKFRVFRKERRKTGSQSQNRDYESGNAQQDHDRAADARADQKRPGRLAVCFILLGVHDLKDILREEQHEKTDQREKESACQKSPSRAFSPSCFWNCKIKFCNIILQFCRCGG
jgi:hypothetical protein